VPACRLRAATPSGRCPAHPSTILFEFFKQQFLDTVTRILLRSSNSLQSQNLVSNRCNETKQDYIPYEKGVCMKCTFAGVALASLIAIPFSAQAQFAKVDDAVKYRQSALTVMATHFGRVGAVVKGERPYDKSAVEADVAIVEMMSKLPWSAFPQGSDTANSKAKPEIWKEQDKFKAASDKMQSEVGKLSAAGKSGDLNAIKAALGAVGQSCKACHDDFRKK
jgi:cytochrome c556